MIVIMRDGAAIKEISGVIRSVESTGGQAHVLTSGRRVVIGVSGPGMETITQRMGTLAGVRDVVTSPPPFQLASRLFNPDDTVVKVGKVAIGAGTFTIIAGPCSIESEEQLMKTAEAVKIGGGDMLRGGAFKPRTSPYAFQGLGLKGLKLLAQAGRAFEIPVVTEVLDTRDVSWVSEYTDVIQIGARNMQNFSLLKEVGKTNKPILLKRGMLSTIEEWLNCAEYILNGGNSDIILCERGIRTFETYTRNTLDISAVPAAKELSHLPVMVDPSHATGKVSLIEPASLASVAAGANGLTVEVHCNPQEALSDKEQALTPAQFCDLGSKVRALYKFMSTQAENANCNP
jgi:3-deoxy-7-phosphoheptulonate synthase